MSSFFSRRKDSSCKTYWTKKSSSNKSSSYHITCGSIAFFRQHLERFYGIFVNSCHYLNIIP